MSTYHERLRVALDAGHPTTGAYSGGADAAADEAAINAQNLPGDRPITEAEAAIRASGKWTQYHERGRQDVGNPSDPDYKKFVNPAMSELMSAFIARTDNVNYRDPYWTGVLDACVTEGSMGSGAAEQLKAWSDNQQSHAGLEGLGRPTVGDIEKAWSL